jgi:glyoxylate utilization-related uncharacterized protein
MAVVYFEIEPVHRLGTHTDSAEEILLVLDGTAEVSLGDEQGQFTPGEMAVVPAMVPHGLRNVGDETARFVGFFSSNVVVSTFDQPLLHKGPGYNPGPIATLYILPANYEFLRVGLPGLEPGTSSL